MDSASISQRFREKCTLHGDLREKCVKLAWHRALIRHIWIPRGFCKDTAKHFASNSAWNLPKTVLKSSLGKAWMNSAKIPQSIQQGRLLEICVKLAWNRALIKHRLIPHGFRKDPAKYSVWASAWNRALIRHRWIPQRFRKAFCMKFCVKLAWNRAFIRVRLIPNRSHKNSAKHSAWTPAWNLREISFKSSHDKAFMDCAWIPQRFCNALCIEIRVKSAWNWRAMEPW